MYSPGSQSSRSAREIALMKLPRISRSIQTPDELYKQLNKSAIIVTFVAGSDLRSPEGFGAEVREKGERSRPRKTLCGMEFGTVSDPIYEEIQRASGHSGRRAERNHSWNLDFARWFQLFATETFIVCCENVVPITVVSKKHKATLRSATTSLRNSGELDRGIKPPSFENLEVFCTQLGIPVHELFVFEDNAARQNR